MNERGIWVAIVSSIILLSGVTSITIYNDVFAAPSEKIEICHKPDTPAEKTLVISVNAWPGHLAHGDKAFACDSIPPPPTTGFIQVSCICGGTAQPEVCLELFCDNGGHVDDFCRDYCETNNLGEFSGLDSCRNDNGCTLPP